MHIKAFTLLLLLSSFLSAQTGREKELDSLESLYKKTKTEIKKVDVLCLLTRAYGGVDSLKCFNRGYKALEISNRINYLKGSTDAYIALAGGYLDYFNLKKAKELFKKGNTLADKLVAKDSSVQNLKLWMRGNYNLGVTYGYEGNLQKEIEYANKAIPVAEKIGDTLFIANANTNLGIKYSNLSLPKKAYPKFKQSEKQYNAVGNAEDKIFHSISFATCLHGMDSITAMKEQLDKAKKYLDLAPDSFYASIYYRELGLYLSEVDKHDEGIKALDKSFSYFANNPEHGLVRLIYQRYAEIYDAMGNSKKAIDYTNKYLYFANREPTSDDKLRGMIRLSKFEADTKNYKNAYNYLKQYTVALDSLRLDKLDEDMMRLELQYETAKNEKEILMLQNKNNEAALSLEKRKSQAYMFGGIASVLMLLLFISYYAYSQKLRKARKKERLQEAEVQFLKQEQQNKVFSAMIEGQEKERKRLAIDLHDGLGGRLSGISLNLSKLNKDEPKQYPKKQLQKVMKDLDASLVELRGIARNMMPETLVKFGLEAALKDYCSSMNTNETKVSLQFYGTDKGVDLNQQVTMYRVIQELINNAIKHAEASEILVQYMREGNNVDITVEDNGIGLSNDIFSKEGSGMGFSNLRTRVAYLKGDLDFHTETNEGTTVNVHIQIDAA